MSTRTPAGSGNCCRSIVLTSRGAGSAEPPAGFAAGWGCSTRCGAGLININAVPAMITAAMAVWRGFRRKRAKKRWRWGRKFCIKHHP
ncbi:MAG: hypothetical protein KGZ76_09575, partial [Dethiobacter sp.]|nr:hypothetical protein [Dethiobacter sp.]